MSAGYTAYVDGFCISNVCESIVSGMTSHKDLDRFRHFWTPCQSINRSNHRFCRFCAPFNGPIQHVVYVKKIKLSDRRRRFCIPFNGTIPHVGGLCIDIVSGMSSHKDLDRFCHFWTPFNRSFIIPPFLHTMSAPFNRSIIDSAVFAYHLIGLYSMWLCTVSTIVAESIVSGMTLHEHLDRFCHFYTPFNSFIIIPPFLHTMSAPFNRSNIGSAGRNVDMNRFVNHFTNDTGLNDLLVHELMCRVLNWVVLTSRFNEHYYYVCWIW